MKTLLISFIRLYSYLISPLLGQNCRFHPTCSAYAIEALEGHGLFKGAHLAAKRLLRCHPWHRGDMIDPVPPASLKAANSIAQGQGIGYKHPHSNQTK